MPEAEKTNRLGKIIKISALSIGVVYLLARAAYGAFTVSTKIAPLAATLYLIDYRFYFGSRTFIGSILTLLTDHISVGQIFAMNIFFYCAAIALFLLLGLSFARQAVRNNNNLMFLLALLFLVSPFSLMQYGNWVGSYDIILCAFSLLCCLFIGKRGLRWLCPALCVAAVFTHYAFVFSYYPAILSFQVYAIINSNKKLRDVAAAAVTFVFSFVSGLYCGLFANRTIKMSADELYAYMSQRLGERVENRDYFDSYYFNSKSTAEMLQGISENILSEEFFKKLLFVLLPVLAVLLFLWVKSAISAGKSLQAVPYAFFAISMVVSVGLIFCIIESDRWITAAMLSQYMLLFGSVRLNGRQPSETLQKADKPVLNIAVAVTIAVNIAASFIMVPHVLQ